MSRPEDTLPPDLFYDDPTSLKYTTSSRIQAIQSSMTHRALSLLHLTTPSLILDVGCGSGLSGEILSSIPPSSGGPHTWIGLDISPSMLDIALQRDVPGDLFLSDIGQGIPFRPGTFDAAISISAVQWLCNVEETNSGVSAEGRLKRFFEGLYASLRRGGKAVLQFYPKNQTQRDMISKAAIRAGFSAGILEDDGGTKNVKTYLVLSVGGNGDITGVVEGMEDVDVEDNRRAAKDERRRLGGGNGRQGGGGGSTVAGANVKGSKAWILRKKEQMRNKGKVVKSSSKYTGRKRRIQF